MIPPVESPDQQSLAVDLEDCLRQLEAIDTDAAKLAAGLNEDQFHWAPASSRWSIAQCVIHLVIIGRQYLPILDQTIERAREGGLLGGGPFRYGFFERWLIGATEPPPRIRLRTPASARPRNDQPLDAVMADFLAVQAELKKRLRAANGVDLARAKVTSPFVKALKMGLGPCFSFLAAHERRHLWQAWQVRTHPKFPAQ
jgi:DinB superfamily